MASAYLACLVPTAEVVGCNKQLDSLDSNILQNFQIFLNFQNTNPIGHRPSALSLHAAYGGMEMHIACMN